MIPKDHGGGGVPRWGERKQTRVVRLDHGQRRTANDERRLANDERPTTFMKALRNLRLIGIALAVLTLVGMVGFRYIEGWSWFDGFYMVVTSFSTIGYQEVHPLSHPGRVFNVCLILCGVSLVFLGIGSLTQALLEFELSSFFGRRKMAREIEQLADHYIICGAGRVGRSAARELKRRPVPFVIIEQNEAKAA